VEEPDGEQGRLEVQERGLARSVVRERLPSRLRGRVGEREAQGVRGEEDRLREVVRRQGVGGEEVHEVRAAIELGVGEPRILAAENEREVARRGEPTAGMGTEERWRMIDKVYELWERQKITVVFIEHDMDIVFKIAPSIVVLSYGRILATGTPDAIRQNPAVIDAYLGTEHHAEAT